MQVSYIDPTDPRADASLRRSRCKRSPYAMRGFGGVGMAKTELSGKVTAFRQSKFKQDSYQTIVQLASADVARKAIGASVVWRREDGLQIQGRVVASHGSKGAVRVRWNRGFPPQGLGSEVKIHS